MPKPSDDALAASMRTRRAPETVTADVASTVVGQLAAEVKDAALVPVSQIQPSPYQSRAEVNDEHIESLMASIEQSGLLVPVLLRKVSNFDTFELVAGHNRLEAFKRLGRDHIPAIVRPLSDRDAARALTVENTHHKTLTDWELYKHLKMLRTLQATKNVTDMAAVLGVGRTHIYNLEAFSALPDDLSGLLDRMPALIGGRLAYDLQAHAKSHPAIVSEAVRILAEGKLKQAGILGWIERRINPPDAARPDVRIIKGEGKAIKLIVKDGEAKVSGDLNFDRLHALIEANLSSLLDPPAPHSATSPNTGPPESS